MPEFTQAIEVLLSFSYPNRSNQTDLVEVSQALLALTVSGEIRDLDWMNGDQSLYSALHTRLLLTWNLVCLSDSLDEIEAYLLKVWNGVVLLPEFDRSIAFNTNIDAKFIDAVFRQILSLSKADNLPVSDNNKTVISPRSAMAILQHMLLYIYQNRIDLRILIRHSLTKYLSAVQNNASDRRMSKISAGKSRAHVQPLLKVLNTILSGLQTAPQDADAYQIRHRLLMEVLLPLHYPSEMTEWRDQIPVIQTYHEELVRSLVLLAEKTDTNTNSKQQPALLSIILQEILKNWPDGFNTNTPKQVLLLHEMELLLAICDLTRFIPIQNMILVRTFLV